MKNRACSRLGFKTSARRVGLVARANRLGVGKNQGDTRNISEADGLEL
jgi:hypothetical protein